MKLKTKLSKLRHDGHITDAEYAILINALNRKPKERVIAEIKVDEDTLRKLVKDKVDELTTKFATEPCEDCISRVELLENAYLLTDDEGITHEVVHADDIRYSIPMTWSGWKSVTWELPEPNTAVLLYVKYKSSGQWTYQLGMWDDSKLAWEDWRTPYQLEEEFEVIAWMELPEGYEEGKHE